MSHDNSAITRRWFEEVWNLRRAETIDELMTSESICYVEDGPLRGPDEFKERQYQPFLAAFSDIRVEVEGILSEGDHVVVRWVATGTHDGEGLGFRATHEKTAFQGMTWIQFRDGKLLQGWQSSNIPDVIRRLSITATA